MTQASDFYQVLGVPPDAEPGRVEEHVRERLGEFKTQVERADDPDAVQSQLLIAYEVLTDPEERYLYELYDHERYMQRRLDGQTLQELSGVGSESITPVFGGEAAPDDAEDDAPSDARIFDPGASASAVGAGPTVASSAVASNASVPETPADAPGAGPADRDRSRAGDATTAGDDGEASAAGESTAGRAEGAAGDGAPADGSQQLDLSRLSEETTLLDRLAAFPLSKSPVTALPGLDTAAHRRPAATGYGVALLGAVFALGALSPFGSVVMGAVAVAGVLVGATASYLAGALWFERELTYRAGAGVVASAPLVAVPLLGVPTPTPDTVLVSGAVAAGLLGTASANTYVEATRKRIRKTRNLSDGRGGSTYVETDPTMGTDDDGIAPREVLEALVDAERGATSRPPADLPEAATVHATRRLVPRRHIYRELQFEDERTSHEVPESEFSSVRADLREDVEDRNDHHPDGFTERTDEYLDPRSVTDRACPKCSGAATVECRTCTGDGSVPCSDCDGEASTTCGRCGGTGLDSDGDYCSDCDGSGAVACEPCSATGSVTCDTCSGAGSVRCDRCGGDGRVVQFTRLTRTYEPVEGEQYATESLPEAPLHAPEGEQVKKDREHNEDLGASSSGWLFNEHEIREIPTEVVTYEYAGDLWEAYRMAGRVESPNYPRALRTRTQLLAATAVACGVLLTYVVAVGPSGPP